jgi:hypothetical protein
MSSIRPNNKPPVAAQVQTPPRLNSMRPSEVKARDPKNLRHLKAAEELVVTVSCLTAITVDKESAG